MNPTPIIPKITQSTDLELSGGLNRAVSEGARFSLMLAMLQSNMLERPQLANEAETIPVPSEFLNSVSYPRPALQPEADDWRHLDTAKRMLHQVPQDAWLYQTLHPQPLSLYDDAKRIDDVVAFNCDYYTQQRLQAERNENVKEPTIELDETGLYDVLQELDIQPSFAA